VILIIESMFIASDNELREFTCKLLGKNFSCEVIKMLQQEDEKYLCDL
jgi:hypothetical protein